MLGDCQLLTFKIFDRAIRDWRAEITVSERRELTAFFRSSWCEFLYTSITDMPVERMWEELGVPEVDRGA